MSSKDSTSCYIWLSKTRTNHPTSQETILGSGYSGRSSCFPSRPLRLTGTHLLGLLVEYQPVRSPRPSQHFSLVPTRQTVIWWPGFLYCNSGTKTLEKSPSRVAWKMFSLPLRQCFTSHSLIEHVLWPSMKWIFCGAWDTSTAFQNLILTSTIGSTFEHLDAI